MAAFSTFKIGKHQMDTFKQYCKEHQDEIYKRISQNDMQEEFNKMADPTVSDKEAQEAAYKIVSAVEEATRPTDLLCMYLVQFFCESTKENIFNN